MVVEKNIKMQGTNYTHWLIVKPNRLRCGNPTAHLYINIPPGIFFEGAARRGMIRVFFSTLFSNWNESDWCAGRKTDSMRFSSEHRAAIISETMKFRAEFGERQKVNFLSYLFYNTFPQI